MKKLRFAAVTWVVILMTVAAVAQKPENPKTTLNGGLEAEITSVGLNTRDPNYPTVSMSMKISNKGKSTVFLLLYGEPSLVDDAGGKFDTKRVNGVAYCPGPQTNPPSIQLCIGIPHQDSNLFSPRGYTQIDPDRSITATFFFQGTGRADRQHVIFSQNIAYRLVSDTAADATLTDTAKLKQAQLGTLSFEPVAVVER